jgi:hypothetical protein
MTLPLTFTYERVPETKDQSQVLITLNFGLTSSRMINAVSLRMQLQIRLITILYYNPHR